MEEFLISSISNYGFWVYFLLVVVAIVEGPIISFVSGMLVRSDHLLLIGVYFALMVGDLIGDMIWYWLGFAKGERFANRFGKYFSVTGKHLEQAKILFDKYHTGILLFSKITTGFGLATAVLFTAGLARVSFKKYMFLNTLGQIVWTGMLVGSGYFVGHLYSTFNSIFERLAITASIIVIVIFVVGYGKYLKTKISRNI